MGEIFRKLFESMNIEYYALLPYSSLKVTREDIMERENFTPKSVIVYLLPYYTGDTVNISRYAASLDYHIAIREVSMAIENCLKEHFPTAKCKGYGDHSPIDERHAALVGGLGILGKNGLLINEKYGSYIFIGDVITDIEPSELGQTPLSQIKYCTACGACLDACPTGVLRCECFECLSAITQRKGELSDEEISLMRKYNTAWGCDECQSACPHNANVKKTPIEFFYRERIDFLTKKALEGMTKDEFSRRAYAWRGRKTVERNLEILEEKSENVN